MDENILEEIVRKVVAEHLAVRRDSFESSVDEKSGVRSIKTSTVKPERFDTGKKGDQVYLKDVVTLEQSPRLGCGVMEMTESTFDWTLNYDEIDYVIEGRLEIVIDGKKVIGEKGDILLIPKNTAIQFCAPNFARFLYVTYPANWEDQ